jgi:hypothetical protein
MRKTLIGKVRLSLNYMRRHYKSTTLRVLSSQPRSGTHWLKFMISHVLGQPPFQERRLQEPSDLIYALEHEAARRLIYDHFKYDIHGSILTPERYPGLRMVLLFRHPLDALVSNFYFGGYGRTVPLSPDLSPLERMKIFLHNHSESIRWNLCRRVVDWLKTGYCLPVRYEDLVADTERQLTLVLDYLNIKHRPEIVAEAIERYRFEALSKGRSPGVVDPNSHYRRGVPGEWREVFDQEDLEVVRSQIGDYLEFLGYPLE